MIVSNEESFISPFLLVTPLSSSPMSLHMRALLNFERHRCIAASRGRSCHRTKRTGNGWYVIGVTPLCKPVIDTACSSIPGQTFFDQVMNARSAIAVASGAFDEVWERLQCSIMHCAHGLHSQSVLAVIRCYLHVLYAVSTRARGIRSCFCHLKAQ